MNGTPSGTNLRPRNHAASLISSPNLSMNPTVSRSSVFHVILKNNSDFLHSILSKIWKKKKRMAAWIFSFRNCLSSPTDFSVCHLRGPCIQRHHLWQTIHLNLAATNQIWAIMCSTSSSGSIQATSATKVARMADPLQRHLLQPSGQRVSHLGSPWP